MKICLYFFLIFIIQINSQDQDPTDSPEADIIVEATLYFTGNTIQCPTSYYKCGNSDCQPTSTTCLVPRQNPTSPNVQCYDGIVRSSSSLCPQEISCPKPTQIRCWNGQCANSISECPTYTA